MVDVTDSKSVGGNTVWVRVPPPAPRQNKAMRSCGGTSTATSTDDLVFPFQPRPADAGLASDRETGSDLDHPCGLGRSSLRTARKWQSRMRLPFSHLCSVAPPSQIVPASLGSDLDSRGESGLPRRGMIRCAQTRKAKAQAELARKALRLMSGCEKASEPPNGSEAFFITGSRML